MRKIVALLGSFLVGFAVSAQEPNDRDGEVRYISDDLYTFIHAGPGRNYRILGSVGAGTRVVQLQVDTEANFVEIIDDKQRTGWVDATFITNSRSIRDMVPELREDLAEANQLVQSQQSSNDLLNQQIADLSSQNTSLQQQLNKVEAENQKLSLELQSQDQSAQMEWFTRGGIIALGGLILGVIIAYLPKKRRRNDQWM